MLHAACMQVNWVDSWFLMVGSQIVKLTPDLSFGHNLCFRCSNGWYEPILNIYVSITFQWYKELFNPLGFDPCNGSLNIWESTGISTPQNGSSIGSVRAYSLTLSCTPESMWRDSRASLLACNLATPCLGREPKARVATTWVAWITLMLVMVPNIYLVDVQKVDDHNSQLAQLFDSRLWN